MWHCFAFCCLRNVFKFPLLCPLQAIAPGIGISVEDSKGKVEKLKAELKNNLELFQNYFLSGEGPFILGAEISIADVQCLCELTQFWMIQAKVEDHFPKIKAWMKACQDYLGDAFEKAHAKIYELAEIGRFPAGFEFA